MPSMLQSDRSRIDIRLLRPLVDLLLLGLDGGIGSRGRRTSSVQVAVAISVRLVEAGRVGRGKSGVGVGLVGTGTNGVIGGSVGGNGAVNVVTVSHSLDLVVGELGKLGGDQRRATLGDVGVREQDVELFERTARGLGVKDPDNGEKDAIGDGEQQKGVGVDRGGHRRKDLDDEEV